MYKSKPQYAAGSLVRIVGFVTRVEFLSQRAVVVELKTSERTVSVLSDARDIHLPLMPFGRYIEVTALVMRRGRQAAQTTLQVLGVKPGPLPERNQAWIDQALNPEVNDTRSIIRSPGNSHPPAPPATAWTQRAVRPVPRLLAAPAPLAPPEPPDPAARSGAVATPKAAPPTKTSKRAQAANDDSPWPAVLFLDIDDVLCDNKIYGGRSAIAAIAGHHKNSRDVFEKLFTPMSRLVLQRLHRRMQGELRYVVSSTWRRHFTRAQFELLLRNCGLAFVADALMPGSAWRTNCRDDGHRDLEVVEWLHENHHGGRFAVVDDTLTGGRLHSAGLHRLLRGRVVLCDVDVGLRPRHEEQLLHALQLPRSVQGGLQ